MELVPGVAYPWRTIGWRLASKRSSKSPIDSCFLLKPRSVTVKRCPSQRGILPSSPALAHGKQNRKHLRLLDHWIRQVATSAGPTASLEKVVVFAKHTLIYFSFGSWKICSAIFTVTHHAETHWKTWSSRKHQTYYINCIVCWISEYLNKCILYNHIMYIWKPQSSEFESHQSEKLTGLQNHARFVLIDSSTKTRHSWASRNATLQELAKWLVRKA